MRLVQSRVLLILSTFLLSSAVAFAARQSHREENHQMHMHGQQEPTMEMCKQMMAQHNQFQNIAKEMDQKLGELLTEMNQTEGERKIEKMSAIVNMLAEQRSLLNESMLALMPNMMQHISEHMKTQEAEGHSMKGCPMMQKMGQATKDSDSHDHSMHR